MMSSYRAAYSARYIVRTVGLRSLSRIPIARQLSSSKRLKSNTQEPSFFSEYKSSFDVPPPTLQLIESIPRTIIGNKVTAVGFLGKKRDVGRLRFAPLRGGSDLREIQIFSSEALSFGAWDTLEKIPTDSAVSVTGVLSQKRKGKKTSKPSQDTEEISSAPMNELEIQLESITCLNEYPADLRPLPNQTYGPQKRHLQIRFDSELRKRLQFRSKVAAFARQEFSDFQEIETPLLFKSTPEGAREFLVPTRIKGHAFGLPQSPQQYKQILMSSGVHKYIQFAKCFRDEDYRADRQPEFTQIDLEMAWSDGEDVMERVEKFIENLWEHFAKAGAVIHRALEQLPFPRLTYNEAMSFYGSDKPDLRIRGKIHPIKEIIPSDLTSMITSIQKPIIEAWKVRLDSEPWQTMKFIQGFLDSPEGEVFNKNVAGGPGVFVYDSRKPLQGLQAFGFEGAEKLQELYTEASGAEEATDMEFEDGDLLIIQAREDLPHTGGSTPLGQLRIALQKAAIKEGLLPPDRSHNFLWVTDFPLFTLDNSTEPGQGEAGFSATHHPFTAPKTADDVDMLLIDPLKVIADHYDLVLNGVELGGGSRRIHHAEMQKFILENVIKIDAERMESFSHLLEALRSACPPHAGLAIGFDRLVAMMQGRESVRDVIAFPKDKNGRDLMVKSPSKVTAEQLEQYHLGLTGDKENSSTQL
ncbi:tRNA synthetases class II-domain-containing protein [Calycina marina]|uniref:tRNA synthetases class II-domain-containing protein n=1 Tax=Calycina marina TaxID=1763456 RepID=A0A9P8CG50_9HELO|nr:tRNA synthetases class II-domain-containing protein [Calycina marina]